MPANLQTAIETTICVYCHIFFLRKANNTLFLKRVTASKIYLEKLFLTKAREKLQTHPAVHDKFVSAYFLKSVFIC